MTLRNLLQSVSDGLRASAPPSEAEFAAAVDAWAAFQLYVAQAEPLGVADWTGESYWAYIVQMDRRGAVIEDDSRHDDAPRSLAAFVLEGAPPSDAWYDVEQSLLLEGVYMQLPMEAQARILRRWTYRLAYCMASCKLRHRLPGWRWTVRSDVVRQQRIFHIGETLGLFNGWRRQVVSDYRKLLAIGPDKVWPIADDWPTFVAEWPHDRRAQRRYIEAHVEPLRRPPY
jgi:hypothetical protein